MGTTLSTKLKLSPSEETQLESGVDDSLESRLLAPPSSPRTAEPKGWLLVAVFAALFMVQIASAAYGVVTKVAVAGASSVNPLVFSLVRDALSIPVLGLIALIIDGFMLPARRDLMRFALLGVFGMFANQFCYILGLVYIDAGLASVINLLTPVCAWCFATTIGLDRFSWFQAAGLVVAVIGAMIFVGVLDLPNNGGTSSTTPTPPSNASLWLEDSVNGNGVAASVSDLIKGSLSVLGSCLAYSLALILMKPMVKAYPPVTVTAWSYVSGAIVTALAALIYFPWSKEWLERPDPFANGFAMGDAWGGWEGGDAWIAIAVAVIANSVLKYGLTSFANKHTSITVLAMFGTLVPVLTYFGEWLAGEHLRWRNEYLGAIAIAAGLITVVFFKGPAPNPTNVGPCRRWMLRVCARVVPGDEDDDQDDEEEEEEEEEEGRVETLLERGERGESTSSIQ